MNDNVTLKRGVRYRGLIASVFESDPAGQCGHCTMHTTATLREQQKRELYTLAQGAGNGLH